MISEKDHRLALAAFDLRFAPMRGARCLAVLMTVVLIGGHAVALQVVAWAGMLTTRSQTMSWSAAVSTTFSGLVPCRICYAVSSLQNNDVPQAPVGLLSKPDFAPVKQVSWELPESVISELAESLVLRILKNWTSEVPTPPPQSC